MGKSSVARHLAQSLRWRRVDLDHVIETREKRKIVEIIDAEGIDRYREIESQHLATVVQDPDTRILSLGGGTWTLEGNRCLIRENGFSTIWLEATFEHCWLNISFSRKERPLARDKNAAYALFEQRQSVYCLADFRINVRSGDTSANVAERIVDEIIL